MPNLVLRFERNYPILNGMAEKALLRRIPADIAKKISGLDNAASARSLVRNAGFKVQDLAFYENMPDLAVQIEPPEGLPDKELAPTIICFSKLDRVRVSAVAASLKFALPASDKLSESEDHYGKFQRVIDLFSERVMGSFPFLCVLGNLVDHPSHALSRKGFTFLYSSEPDELFKIVRNVLSMELEIRKRETRPLMDPSIADHTLVLLDDLEKARRGISGDSPTLISQVRLYAWNTRVIDMRESEISA